MSDAPRLVRRTFQYASLRVSHLPNTALNHESFEISLINDFGYFFCPHKLPRTSRKYNPLRSYVCNIVLFVIVSYHSLG